MIVERTEQDNAEGRSMNELILARTLSDIYIRTLATEALKETGLARML